MGWVSRLVAFFQPSEVREALNKGDKILRKAEAEAKHNAMSRKDYRAAMKEGKKAFAAESKKLRKEEKQARKDSKVDLKKDWTEKEENAWLMHGIKRDKEKVKAAQDLARGLKAANLDALSRQTESMSEQANSIYNALNSSQKITLRISQHVTNQENALDRLAEVLSERAELDEEIVKIGKSILTSFDKKKFKEKEKLLNLILKKDKEIAASFQSIIRSAAENSPIRGDVEMVLQTLAPVAYEANNLAKRVREDTRYINKLLAFQASILRASRVSLKSQGTEIEKINKFAEQARRKAA